MIENTNAICIVCIVFQSDDIKKITEFLNVRPPIIKMHNLNK